EAGAPVQMDDAAQVPGGLIVGNITCPRTGRIMGLDNGWRFHGLLAFRFGEGEADVSRSPALNPSSLRLNVSQILGFARLEDQIPKHVANVHVSHGCAHTVAQTGHETFDPELAILVRAVGLPWRNSKRHIGLKPSPKVQVDIGAW